MSEYLLWDGRNPFTLGHLGCDLYDAFAALEAGELAGIQPRVMATPFDWRVDGECVVRWPGGAVLQESATWP